MPINNLLFFGLSVATAQQHPGTLSILPINTHIFLSKILVFI